MQIRVFIFYFPRSGKIMLIFFLILILVVIMCRGGVVKREGGPLPFWRLQTTLPFFQKGTHKWKNTKAFGNSTKMSDWLKVKAFILVFIYTLNLGQK